MLHGEKNIKLLWKMFVCNPEASINSCQLVSDEADCCVVLLLQQYGLVLVNKCDVEFEHFMNPNFYNFK